MPILKIAQRVDDFFEFAATQTLEFRRVKLVDKVLPCDSDGVLGSPDHRPIVKYLVFGERALPGWGEERPLSPLEVARIEDLRSRISVYSTSEDFHVESINGTNIPNRIVDVVIIGRRCEVERRLQELGRDRNRLRRQLMSRLRGIRDDLADWSPTPITCVAYRGELALRGRFPGDDIDLLISCESENHYPEVQSLILSVARRLKFTRVDWIQMHRDEHRQSKEAICTSPDGKYRLDCYVTVAEHELLRVEHESPIEALWVLGVLRNAKPLLNAEYFDDYVHRFEFKTAQRLESTGPK